MDPVVLPQFPSRDREGRRPKCGWPPSGNRVCKRLSPRSTNAIVQRWQAKRRDSPADARASETDPDAANMKLADGSYPLAYNLHLVTDPSMD